MSVVAAILCAVLAVLFLVDAARLRRRALAFSVLPADAPKSPDDGDWLVVTRSGVQVPPTVRRAAIQHALAKDLQAVDLFPPGTPSADAFGLLAMIDPETYRAERLHPGRTAGYAFIARRELLERSQIIGEAGGPVEPAADPVAFQELADLAKRHASDAHDFAVAPGLAAQPLDLKHRYALLRVLFVRGAPLVTFIPVVMAVILGALIVAAPAWGLAAYAALQVQPLIALAGTSLQPAWLFPYALFRTPMDISIGLVAMLSGWRPPGDAAQMAELRQRYTSALAGGVAPFYDPRRDTCPICHRTELSVYRRFPDMLQHKPGRSVLERCAGCDHIFQNPRLSIAGLGFYYGDFYDGLGEASSESLFRHGGRSFLARAQMVADARKEPVEAWLDVGGAGGHFCCMARDVYPKTRFDALDLSEAVEVAERRGWADNGYRALFPEVADDFAQRYDVVSMSHYLEHTTDQRAELAAAAKVLRPGGHLMIELPDPTSKLGQRLGTYWLPWFQPQHLHLVSPENLTRLLKEAGFEVLHWHRREAHQPIDLFFGMFLLTNRAAGPGELPWLPPRTALHRLRRTLLWTIGLPLMGICLLLDRMLAGVVSPNTFRVVARRSTP